MRIKEKFEHIEKLYHFTSFDTALKIIDSNRLRFGKLTNMNDLHENDKIACVGSDGMPFRVFPSDVLDALTNEIYKYRQISLTCDKEGKKGKEGKEGKEGFDLHQMWGLYASKGEGVCLVFDRQELCRCFDRLDRTIYNDIVVYDEELDSAVISYSESPDEVVKEINEQVAKIFFHKRKEWEHEQEYRLLMRCENPMKEEYLPLGHSLKYIIVSSKFRNTNEVLYFNNIEKLKDVVAKRRETRNKEDGDEIIILVYGNSPFDYALSPESGEEIIWSSSKGYNTLILGDNCRLDI